jgi:CheY-like chemotaxis protein
MNLEQTGTSIPTVLLVEDSEDDAYFFRRTLEKSELTCSLVHVVNGLEAVTLLRNALRSEDQNLPRTIFLDLKMPVLNGFEFLEWMRTQNFFVPIQVAVLSGSEREDDKQRAAQLGATDYLVKPIRVGDLHRVLHDVCPPRIGAHV